MWPGILLHLLRQSLFVRPGSFAAMRFQSLTLPRLTERRVVISPTPAFRDESLGNVLTLRVCFLSKNLVLFLRPPPTDSRCGAHLIFFYFHGEQTVGRKLGQDSQFEKRCGSVIRARFGGLEAEARPESEAKLAVRLRHAGRLMTTLTRFIGG